MGVIIRKIVILVQISFSKGRASNNIATERFFLISRAVLKNAS